MGAWENGVDSAWDLDHLSQTLLASSIRQRSVGLVALRHRFEESGQYILSYKARRSEISPISDVPQDLFDAALNLLFRTYPYYTDRSSRSAVRQLLENDHFYPPHTLSLVDAYQQECSKQGLASSNAFVLVEWGSVILRRCADHPQAFKRYGSTIIQAQAQVLEICMRSKTRARRSVQDAACRSAKRAIRAIQQSQGQGAVRAIVDSLASDNPRLKERSAPMLGVIGSACAGQQDVLYLYKNQIFAFYTREILGSRSPVPNHIAAGLKGFFQNFTSLDDFKHEIVPALEKAMLRAPEVVMNDVIAPLIESLPHQHDLVESLANNLLKPLLANIKSQNDLIRDGAVSAYVMFVNHSSEEKHIQRIISQLIDAISQSKAPMERLYIAQMLAGTQCLKSTSISVCEALTKNIAKESHEGSLKWQINALLKHVVGVSPERSPDITKSVSDAATKGLKDKKAGTRRLWMLALGDFMWSYYSNSARTNPDFGGLIESTLAPLLTIRDEVVLNPFLAAQSGLAVGALIITAIWPKIVHGTREATKTVLQKIKSPIAQALSPGSESSFLLSHKVYSKLDPSDIPWMVRALTSCSESLSKSPLKVQVAWGEAFTYAIAAAGVSSATRHLAMSDLTDMYSRQKAVIADAIIPALWKWHHDFDIERRDTPASAAKTGISRLHLVLRSICPSSPSTSDPTNSGRIEVQAQLVKMLVLCRPEIIPAAHWIEICLRMGEDPGMIAQTRAAECLSRIEDCLFKNRDESPSIAVRSAAHNAAAELAFVGPEAIIPLLVHRIKNDLSADEVSLFGPREVAIAHTPEGTVFAEVLSSHAQNDAIHKNSPDYEIAKWEHEMRSEIARKTGQDRKLNAEEKAKVNAQLHKEAAIRQEVRRTEDKLRNGTGLIHALAVGPPTDAKLWMSSSLQALLGVVSAGAGKVVGRVADDAYLACAMHVASRLGVQRHFVGIATLRAVGSSTIPDEYMQEPLQGTIVFAWVLPY